jgi:hypothetical protein
MAFVALAAVSLIMAGCAETGPWRAAKGQYTDYHDYVAKTMAEVFRPHVAPGAVAPLSNCAGDLEVAQFGPEELTILDAAARGEVSAPAPLVKEAIRQSERTMGTTTQELRQNMRSYCPDVITRYGTYLNYKE